MSKKLHSGLKRTLAWMLVVALMVQGCMVVYADYTEVETMPKLSFKYRKYHRFHLKISA